MPYPTQKKRSNTRIPANSSEPEFNPTIAGRALVQALKYFQKRIGWSGIKIAKTLHLAPKTFNTWLKNGTIPLSSRTLPPDIEVIVHLLAIHRSLEAMFDDPEDQQAWLRTLHPTLNRVPEELMSESTKSLIDVRNYLDYVRGRGA